ncbi:MAG: ATP-binding protein [Methanocella sp.]
MKATELILINWGNVPSKTYTLTEVTALTGETGSGKSSLLDAIVAVMSGGIQRIGRFNSASDDGKTSRHKNVTYRSVGSYVLGGAGTLFARGSAHGYAAMVFEPDALENTLPVTAIFGASASWAETPGSGGEMHRTTTVHDTCLIIVVGERVGFKDFHVPRTDGKVEQVEVSKLADHLRDIYGIKKGHRKTGVIDKSKEPVKFLQALYAQFRGLEEVSRDEAERAAFVFCRFIPQENIDQIGISEFVRRYMLPDPQGTEEFGGMAQHIKANRLLHEQAELIEQRIKVLSSSADAATQYATAFLRGAHLDVRRLEGRRKAVEQQIAEIDRSIKKLHDENIRDEKEVESLKKRLDEARKNHSDLLSQLNMNEPYRNHRELIDRRARRLAVVTGCCVKAKKLARDVQRAVQFIPVLELARSAKHFESLSSLVSTALRPFELALPGLRELIAQLGSMDEQSTESAASLLTAWTTINERAKASSPAFWGMRDSLVGEERPLIAELAAAKAKLEAEEQALQEQRGLAERELALMSKLGRVSYPKRTEDTLKYIKEHEPKANPVVLCDVVQGVRDEQWQAAIEGYIGGSRYDIVVDPVHERSVNRLLDGMPGGRGSLVQSGVAKTEAEQRAPHADSIVHELIVDHPYAKAYLYARFGGVVKVEDAADLAGVRQGLTKSGSAAGGMRTYFALAPDHELTFGRRARELKAIALQKRIENGRRRETEIRNDLEMLRKLQEASNVVEDVGDTMFVDLCTEAITELEQAVVLDEQIKVIDTGSFASLTALEATERELIATREKDIDGLSKDIATRTERIRNQASDREHKVTEQGEAEGDRIAAQSHALALLAATPWIPHQAIEDYCAKQAEGRLPGDEYSEPRRSQLQISQRARNDLMKHLRDYNEMSAGHGGGIAFEKLADQPAEDKACFELAVDIYAEIDKTLSALRNDTLAKIRGKLQEFELEMRRSFSSYFCSRLLREVDNATRIIKDLNSELMMHTFGHDTFEFEAMPASSEYEDRLAFFRFVHEKNDDERFDLFAPDALSEKHAAIRDRILSLFTATDESAREELARISDYRNYRQYEMYKCTYVNGKLVRTALSRQMTDSGGEKETGLLVARAATLSSALHLRDNQPHLRFVAIDELMKKTDEQRIRNAVKYLTDSLKLQVLFVMPTRSIGPFKDVPNSEHNLVKCDTSYPIGELAHKIIAQHFVYDRNHIAKLRVSRIEEVTRKAGGEFDAMEALR